MGKSTRKHGVRNTNELNGFVKARWSTVPEISAVHFKVPSSFSGIDNGQKRIESKSVFGRNVGKPLWTETKAYTLCGF